MGNDNKVSNGNVYDCCNELKEYTCKTCPNFKTNFVVSLKHHIQSGHGNEDADEDRYQCLKCLFVTWSKFVLVKHSFFSECVTKNEGGTEKQSVGDKNRRNHRKARHSTSEKNQWNCEQYPYKDSDEEYVCDSEEASDSDTASESDTEREVSNSQQTPKQVRKKKDLCFFCHTDVMHFSRHIARHHQSEVEVKEILALKVRDRKRKLLFSHLRNKGNFLKSVHNESVVPVRKALDAFEQPTTYTHLPCKYCKGFYKKKYLHRHVKKCPLNNDDKTVRSSAQSDGQSLFSTYRDNHILSKELFPSMRADSISFTAKRDPLICAVARRYLKSHRNTQFRLVVASRKMRQLASLLLEIKKNIDVKSLLDALDPANFDVLVKCTKIISKYNPETETFGIPTLAAQLGIELKYCIDVACKKYRKDDEITHRLKSLRDLMFTKWRDEVSILATSDLQPKKLNKPSLLPQNLEIQKCENTKGLDEGDIKILLLNSRTLCNETSDDKDHFEQKVQTKDISSTEKNCTTRLQAEQPKSKIYVLDIEEVSDSDTASESDTERKISNSQKQAKRVRKKRDHCFFCHTDVMHFARHVSRHHQSEIEVQEILAFKVGDKKRKTLFTHLRNKGNFLKSVCTENVVPIRTPALDWEQPTTCTHLPCKYCKGFYKKKYLYRHVKKCPRNTGDTTVRVNAQSDGQSLFSIYRNNEILCKELFPTMRADSISFAAKKDPLICAVARRYLEAHRDKQYRSIVASRKMRQLALLLLEMKKKIEIKNLLDALDPANFDVLVKCTKIISKYNPETETYGVPSLATHLGTELKYCIDVAFKKYQNENEIMHRLKSLRDLMVSQWRGEFSTLPTSDLQPKEWDKPSLIPLAEGDNNKTDIENALANQKSQLSNISLDCPRKGKRILQPWTFKQKEVTLSFFKSHLKQKRPPKKHECLQLQQENPGLFANKSWEKIKIFVVNSYTYSFAKGANKKTENIWSTSTRQNALIIQEKSHSPNISLDLPQRKRILQPWTSEQKELTLSFFKSHLTNRVPPKKNECLQLQEENPGLFANKSWEKIKIFVVNTYNKGQ